MKTVFSLTAAAMIALSGNVSAASAFSLSSADIPADFRLTQQHVFKGFGCSGENISPQLSWRNPPAGTKSYAITVFDPDAPTGSGWWHWTVVNIPAQIHDLPTGLIKTRYPLEWCRGVMISVMLALAAPVRRRAISLIAISLLCGR
ncbi:putative outer membrane protein [Salmonella enterica subsp. indica]|uniref:Putative outer membrane protein n=1 Tax=Salmonella enterica subsp. indica TaxID=59207 RepID=A0A379XRQ5_SALER|nr:putative outer membrane protein [Salmonella enterica subsp. indica]